MKIKLMSIAMVICYCITANAASDNEVDIGKIYVTQTRMAQHDYKLTGNISVLNRDDIEASNAQTIPEILGEALGIHVSDNGTLKSTIIDIRGFGDTAARNVLVLVNDRKINNVDISAPDLLQIPIESVDRIEIIRGAGSVLYGDNATGGVVNIITKKGEGKLKGKLGYTYGSYDSQSTDLEVSGEKNNISYHVYGKYFDKRGYRDNSDLLAKDIGGRLAYTVSEKLSADLSFGYHKDRQQLPGGLTDAQLVSLGRRGTANPTDIANTEDTFVNLSLDVNPWPEDQDFGTLVVDVNARNRNVSDEFNAFGDFHTKRSIDSHGVQLKYIFDQEVYGRNVNVVTGIDYYDTDNHIKGSGTNVDDIIISKEEKGAYVFLQFEALENLFINGGTRLHKAWYTFDQRNVTLHTKSSPEEVVSMGGVKYEYAQGSNVHANYQQSFRFLATDEWYSTANFPGFGITPGLNTDLKQQTGEQIEVGIVHRFEQPIKLSVTPYYMRLENEIFFDPVTFANSNYDKTKRFGLEFGSDFNLLEIFDIDFLDRLNFFANYTYQRAKFDGGASDGLFIPFVPEHLATHGVVVGFLKHYNLSLIGTYVGSRFAINDTLNVTSREKPYYVLDLKLGYNRKNLEMFIAVNNILNEMYDTYVSKSTSSSLKSHFPAEETNLNFGINLKF